MRSYGLTLLFFVALAAGAFAAPQIVVQKVAGTGKQGLSLGGLKGQGEMGQVFLATLKNDLERSGWFRIEEGVAAGIRLSGEARGDSAAVRTGLEVVWPQGRFAWGEGARGKAEVRRQAHRLSDEIVKRVLGKQGMASARIVMVGKHDGSDLYLCDSDGYGMQRLTQDRVPCVAPNWDPSCKLIYYTTFLRGFPCIYRVPAAGGTRQPLAQFTGLNTGGAISPDRTLMAVILSVSGNPELYVLNLNTRNVTRLTHTPRAAEASPCWSPDGQSIAYVSDVTGRPHIYVMQSATKQSRRLTFRGSENVAPNWGPDGRIAYCTRQSGYQIALLDPASGQTEVLTSGPDHEDPSWAPDARHIVCSRKEGRARSTLYVLDTLGDSPIRLLSHEGNWGSPDWSAN
ncbi:MAG: DPP IV N-terminal domain-containing protein [Kiritimatiellae bacterium]|nr:DPP IV N-terminal domain-containing protein [Kiritimatiellia bacterium]